MYDIFYIAKEKDAAFLDLQKRIPLLKLAKYEDVLGEAFYTAQKKSLSKHFWVIHEEFNIDKDFKFDYVVPTWDEKYVHVFKDHSGEYTGLYLIPKNYKITSREAEYNFFVNKKEIDIVAGSYRPYDQFVIEKPEDYFEAQEKSRTSMFYTIPQDFLLPDTFIFHVPEYDKKYVHMFKEANQDTGIVNLISKKYPITKKEAEYGFFVNKKVIEKNISVPRYDRFVISKAEDYFEAQEKSKTTAFYAIDKDYEIIHNLDYAIPEYDKEYVNVFKTASNEYGAVFLISKEYNITEKEAKYNFFVKKKEHDVIVSRLCFDIVFISYNEENADENWEKIQERFPRAKRIHGIDGIHNAHIEAAKLCNTSMFWVIDGDAVIEDDFDFYLEVPKWDRDAVHVFRSRNPINDLIYGYGGVKLLPRQLVLDMDVNSVDMTTSISKKFISVNTVSNVTAFNTDPFNTWRSAFRECVKLSSKIIDGQVDDETKNRLDVWCSVGIDRPFGEFAIKGAIAGREFGTTYSTDKDMLKKINNWEWLKNEFGQ